MCEKAGGWQTLPVINYVWTSLLIAAPLGDKTTNLECWKQSELSPGSPLPKQQGEVCVSRPPKTVMCYPNSNPIPTWVGRFAISVNCTAKLFRLATKPPFLWDNGLFKRIPLTLIYNPAKPRAIAPYDPHQLTVSCNLMHADGRLKIWARAGKMRYSCGEWEPPMGWIQKTVSYSCYLKDYM